MCEVGMLMGPLKRSPGCDGVSVFPYVGDIEDDGGMLTGCLLAESLRVGVELDLPPSLRLTRIARVEQADATGTQPRHWTLLNFEAADDCATELAELLTGALASGAGWYADFRAGDEHTIVFPGRVFTYAVGDRDGRAAAVAYGLAEGIPESQLDWGE
jgi:hypothetical protein